MPRTQAHSSTKPSNHNPPSSTTASQSLSKRRRSRQHFRDFAVTVNFYTQRFQRLLDFATDFGVSSFFKVQAQLQF